MDTDPAAVVARYWRQVWGEGDLDAVADLFGPEVLRHTRTGNSRVDAAQQRKDLDRYLRSLQDRSVHIDDQATAGDLVWTRLRVRGINTETDPPRPTVISWLQVARVADGRIVESWGLNAPDVDWAEPAR